MLTLGIDIGGTKIRAALVDLSGNIRQVAQTATPVADGREGILRALYSLVDPLVDQVDAIGVGSAGRINVREGSVAYATDNLPGWTGTPLKALLQRRCPKPVFVDNDVNVAALAEGWVGAARGLEHFLCLTLGTGVGGALVSRGQLVHGATWSAGEIGHMLLYPGGRPCNCGGFGCLEQYVSGPALVRSANQMGGANRSGGPYPDGRLLFQAVEAGEEPALKAIDAFCRDLAYALQTLQSVFDPEAVIIGGGLIDGRQVWWERLAEQVRLLCPVPVVTRPAALGGDAGVVGAARLAQLHMEGREWPFL